MAHSVYLFLTVNGVPVEGDSTETSLGRQNSIECLSYRQGGARQIDEASGLPTGRRIHEPLVIRKRIDKSSPLLAQAMYQNRNVDGVFKFFRPNPTGDGTTEHFFTTEITPAVISAVTQFVTDVAEPGTLPDQPLEEITFVFQQIQWTWTSTGVAYGQDVYSIDDGGSFSPGSSAAGSLGAGGGPSGSSPGDSAPRLPPGPFRGVVAEPQRPSRVDAIVPLA